MSSPDDIRRYRSSFIGSVVLVSTLFLIVASFSVYGRAGVVAMTVIWAVGLVLSLGWFLRRPAAVLAVSLVVLAAWVLAVVLAR